MHKVKKVLVTGAAGFIGHKVCEQLILSGVEVVGIDNLNDYYDVKLKTFRLEVLKGYSLFSFQNLDIESTDELIQLFEKNQFDVIYNLAARAGVRYSMENPDIYVSTNVQGNLNLLKMASQFQVEKFVLASTSSLYAGKKMPYKESLDVSEPISPYAATKKAAETMAYTYHHLYGLDVSVVRYFTVYGPLSRPDMAQMRFMKWIDEGKEIQLFGDGEQSRDFTFVDDIARGTILAGKKLGFEIINLGKGEQPISLNSLIINLEALLGKKAKVKKLPIIKADMLSTWADIEKAKRNLDWSPEVSITEGLERSVKHYVDNKDFYRGVLL